VKVPRAQTHKAAQCGHGWSIGEPSRWVWDRERGGGSLTMNLSRYRVERVPFSLYVKDLFCRFQKRTGAFLSLGTLHAISVALKSC